MRIIDSTDTRAVAALLDRRPGQDRQLEARVRRIVDDVRRRGDKALLAYAQKFDRLDGPIEVPREEIEASARGVAPDVRRAIRTAARNIRHVSRRQLPRTWTMSPVAGVSITQRVMPLDRVGCYVPGGRYPLPSSLLMSAIPARVAGVREIVVACPKPDPTVMYAAREAGVTRLLRMGGAQAVAALAYGTATVPRVDKIVGPGNAWVALAKMCVAPECAIDFHAGPSEIAVLSERGRPDWIAADLIAQAEHDPEARAILFTPSLSLALATLAALRTRVPRRGPARLALRRNGGIVLTRTIAEASELIDRLTPEHLVCDSEVQARRLKRAGTVFVGAFSAQACGDYATGSNHVLPTMGAAAARGGLSAADFVRVATLQRVTRGGLRRIAPVAMALAEAEGLTAHAESMRIRLRPVTPNRGPQTADRKTMTATRLGRPKGLRYVRQVG
jgi:histidinol dehydrogenase